MNLMFKPLKITMIENVCKRLESLGKITMVHPELIDSQWREYLTISNTANLTSIYHIYPTPPLGQDIIQGQYFKRSLTGLNLEFSFS